MKRLSIRQYAEHRKSKGLPGQSHTAVRKAIASGRVSLGEDGKLDPERADAQWAATTDVSKRRPSKPSGGGPISKTDVIDRSSPPAQPAAGGAAPLPPEEMAAVREGLAAAGDRSGPGPGSGSGGGPLPSDATGVTLAQATVAHKALSAKLLKAKLDREHGVVVNRAEAERRVFALARQERDSWLQVPARNAALLAADLGLDAHDVEMALDRLVRAHLEELAKLVVEVGRGPA